MSDRSVLKVALIRRTAIVTCVLAASVAFPRLYAQDTSAASDLDAEGWPRNPSAVCHVAAEVVSHSGPREMLSRAERSIGACPAEASAAIQAAIERLSTSSDRRALSDLLRMGLYVADAGVLSKAIAVALRPSATPEARAVSLLLATGELGDRETYDTSGAWSNEYTGCQALGLDHSLRNASATTLTETSWEELRRAVTTMQADSTTPIQVRNALACAERRLKEGPTPP